MVDFEALGERTIYLDCDVLQADGGTRCASITGAYVALALACARLRAKEAFERSPLTGSVAAVSCGMVDGDRAAGPRLLRGLDRGGRRERGDDRARAVCVEVQATAERTPAVARHLDELLALAAHGIEQLRAAQEQAIAPAG